MKFKCTAKQKSTPKGGVLTLYESLTSKRAEGNQNSNTKHQLKVLSQITKAECDPIVDDDSRGNDQVILSLDDARLNDQVVRKIADIKIKTLLYVLAKPNVNMKEITEITFPNDQQDYILENKFNADWKFTSDNEVIVDLDELKYGRMQISVGDQDTLPIAYFNSKLLNVINIDYAQKIGTTSYNEVDWSVWLCGIQFEPITDNATEIIGEHKLKMSTDLSLDKYKTKVISTSISNLSLESIPISDKFNSLYYKWSKVYMCNQTNVDNDVLTSDILTNFISEITYTRDNYDNIINKDLSIPDQIDIELFIQLLPKIVSAYVLKYDIYESDKIGPGLDSLFKDKKLPFKFSSINYKVQSSVQKSTDLIGSSSSAIPSKLTKLSHDMNALNNTNQSNTYSFYKNSGGTFVFKPSGYQLRGLIQELTNYLTSKHQSYEQTGFFINLNDPIVYDISDCKKYVLPQNDAKVVFVDDKPINPNQNTRVKLDESYFSENRFNYYIDTVGMITIDSDVTVKNTHINLILKGPDYRRFIGNDLDKMDKIHRLVNDDDLKDNDPVSMTLKNSLKTINQLITASISNYSDFFKKTKDASKKYIQDNSSKIRSFMQKNQMDDRPNSTSDVNEDYYLVANTIFNSTIVRYSDDGIDHLSNSLDNMMNTPSMDISSIMDKIGEDIESLSSTDSNFNDQAISDLKPNDLINKLDDLHNIGKAEIISGIRIMHIRKFYGHIESLLKKINGIATNAPFDFFYKSIKSLNASDPDILKNGLNSMSGVVNKLRESMDSFNLSWIPDWQKSLVPSISNLYNKLETCIKRLFNKSITKISNLIHTLSRLDFTSEDQIDRYKKIVTSQFTQLSNDQTKALDVSVNELTTAMEFDFSLSVYEIGKAVSLFIRSLTKIIKILFKIINKIMGGLFEKMSDFDYDPQADPIDLDSLIKIKNSSSIRLKQVISYCYDNNTSLAISNNNKSIKMLIDPNGELNIFASCTTPLSQLPLLTGTVQPEMGLANIGIYFGILQGDDLKEITLLSEEITLFQNISKVTSCLSWLSWLSPINWVLNYVQNMIRKIEKEITDKVKNADWDSIIDEWIKDMIGQDSDELNFDSPSIEFLPSFGFLNLRYYKKGTIVKFTDTFELIGLATIIALTVVTRGSLFSQTARTLSTLRKKRQSKQQLNHITDELSKLDDLERNILKGESLKIDEKKLTNSIVSKLNR